MGIMPALSLKSVYINRGCVHVMHTKFSTTKFSIYVQLNKSTAVLEYYSCTAESCSTKFSTTAVLNLVSGYGRIPRYCSTTAVVLNLVV